MAVLMGGLTLVDTEVDTGDLGVFLAKVTSVATTVIGGTTYLYAAGQSESGIEIFKVAADGTLTSSGQLETNLTSLPGAPLTFDIMTVGTSRYLVTSGGNAASALFTYKIDLTAGAAQGSLTVVDKEEAVGIVGVNQVAATAGGNSFIVSVNDGRMTCLQIAANGQITLRDTETEFATPALPLKGAYQVTSFIRDGVTYIATANRIQSGDITVSDGLGLWRLNANGTLDHLDTEPAFTSNGFSAIDSVVIGGRQFVFVAKDTNNSATSAIVTYEMTAAGTLTFVSECLHVYGLGREMTHFTVDNVTFLSLSTATPDGLTIFGVDGNGTVNFVADQGALPASLDNSQNHTIFQTPDRVFGISGAWTPQGFGGDGNGINSFDLGGGNDVINGTTSADQIIGLLGNDTINAGGGADLAYGGGGNDAVNGDSGNDTLLGGLGNDSLTGGSDADSLSGEAGDDTLAGGTGSDTLLGSDGNDSLLGDDGVDSLLGGLGNDTISGGAGADSLSGSVGDDQIFGDGENDTISGDEGNDSIDGMLNDDSILGGIGEDLVIGGNGNDILYGGSDNDMLEGKKDNDSLWGDDGDDSVYGGDGNDLVNGSAGVDEIDGHTGNDSLFGGTENDLLTGDLGNDSLNGDEGADDLSGEDGNDVLKGGTENDSLFGGAQNDTLYGGDGDDTVLGGLDNDTIYGGTGNDVLKGESGVSLIYGGEGNDTLFGDGEVPPDARGSSLPDGSTLSGGAGADVLHGTTLFDAASYIGSGAVTVFLNAADGTNSGGHAAGDFLDQIDGLIGSNGDDSLTGNADDNDLYGQGGADTIRGGAGNDLIVGYTAPLTPVVAGGDKGNSLFGDAGNDEIRGDAANDSLNGGDGRDILYDGAGRDVLRGGNGLDTFVFTAGELGNDTVIDTFVGFTTNKIDLSDYATFQNLADVLAAANDLRGSAVITLEAGRTLTIQNETKAELFAGMFIFDVA